MTKKKTKIFLNTLKQIILKLLLVTSYNTKLRSYRLLKFLEPYQFRLCQNTWEIKFDSKDSYHRYLTQMYRPRENFMYKYFYYSVTKIYVTPYNISVISKTAAVPHYISILFLKYLNICSWLLLNLKLKYRSKHFKRFQDGWISERFEKS